jgi:hypothetical protein
VPVYSVRQSFASARPFEPFSSTSAPPLPPSSLLLSSHCSLLPLRSSLPAPSPAFSILLSPSLSSLASPPLSRRLPPLQLLPPLSEKELTLTDPSLSREAHLAEFAHDAAHSSLSFLPLLPALCDAALSSFVSLSPFTQPVALSPSSLFPRPSPTPCSPVSLHWRRSHSPDRLSPPLLPSRVVKS